MLCYYCKENEASKERVVNPYTKETLPTCPVCAYSFFLLEEDLKKFSIFAKIGKVAMLGSIICFALYGWKIALACFLIGLALAAYRVIAVGNRAERRNAKEGKFAAEKDLFSFYRKDNKNASN